MDIDHDLSSRRSRATNQSSEAPWQWQPMQLLTQLPLPVRHTFEPPSEVTQLAVLEQRGAVGEMRTAQKVGWAVHFHRNPITTPQIYEGIDAVPRGLATILFLHIETARTDFSYNVGLKL